MKAGLVLLLAAAIAPAQEPAAHPHVFLNKTNLALFSADFLARTMDAQSTRRFMTNPCRCFVEASVPWAADSSVKMYGYSLGVASAFMGLSYLAHRTGHHRLERVLPAWDIPYETHLVVSNYRLTPQVSVRR
jgi:hypothetical protein